VAAGWLAPSFHEPFGARGSGDGRRRRVRHLQRPQSVSAVEPVSAHRHSGFDRCEVVGRDVGGSRDSKLPAAGPTTGRIDVDRAHVASVAGADEEFTSVVESAMRHRCRLEWTHQFMGKARLIFAAHAKRTGAVVRREPCLIEQPDS
jgi:hypothetical protein